MTAGNNARRVGWLQRVGATVVAFALALPGIGAASDDGKRQDAVTARALGGGALEVRFQSNRGWTCAGVYQAPGRGGDPVGFPLTCSDKVRARALMSVEDGKAAVIFDRKDGSQGSAVFVVN